MASNWAEDAKEGCSVVTEWKSIGIHFHEDSPDVISGAAEFLIRLFRIFVDVHLQARKCPKHCVQRNAGPIAQLRKGPPKCEVSDCTFLETWNIHYSRNSKRPNNVAGDQVETSTPTNSPNTSAQSSPLCVRNLAGVPVDQIIESIEWLNLYSGIPFFFLVTDKCSWFGSSLSCSF